MTLDSLLLLVYSQLLHMPCELAVAGQQLALAHNSWCVTQGWSWF